MQLIKRIRKYLEVLISRLGMLLIPLLPRPVILFTSKLLGDSAYILPLEIKRIGIANLDIAYGGSKTQKEKKRILRNSFRTFALVILDIFWFTKHPEKRIPKHVRFDPELNELFESKPHVCITAHLGNWELLGHAVSMKGYPLHSVAAPLANPALEPIFNRIRIISGQQIIPRQGAIRAMIRILKGSGKIGLLLDQNTKPSEGGIFVDFMGKPAPISESAAALSLRTRADILFGFCIPKSDGSYYVHTARKLVVDDYVTMDRDKAIEACTRNIAHVIEKAIQDYPGSWLWMYKRWKFKAPDDRNGEYPYYARELGDGEKRRS